MKYSLKKNKFGFIQVKPTPSVEELDKFYKKNFYSINYKNFNNSELKEQVKDKKFYDYKWKRIFDNFKLLKKNFKNKKILDIGCGWGQCLLYLQKKGFDCYGLDPSDIAIKYCKSKGLKAEISNLEKLDIFGNIKFDFIIMNNVLEHLRDPISIIKKVKYFLKKNGVLSIEVPNDFNSFQLTGKIVNKIKNNWWVSPPAHLNYFSHDTLNFFLKKSGFKILKKDSSFPFEMFLLFGDNYVVKKTLGKECHKKRVNFEQNLLRDSNEKIINLFYEKMAEINLGRTAIIYAKIK